MTRNCKALEVPLTGDSTQCLGQGGGLTTANYLRNTLLNKKTYAIFGGGRNHPKSHAERAKSLPTLCFELVSKQKKAWQVLREGFEYLKEVRERNLSCRGFSVRLQYNPKRITSSMAIGVERDRKERQCFLCLNHLPEGQKGILYRNNYLILCNPMPVLSFQFTVSHLDHRDQAIAENIDTFFQLMDDFGSGWTVLYNGPKCGASAPDHHHFHVAPSGQMPIENEIREEKKLTLMKQVQDVFLYRVKDVGREIIILEGDDRMAMEGALKNYLKALKKVLLIDEEPMINIAGFYKESQWEERKWRLVIFPRRKHRPDAFFKEGDDRIVVSPGVIEMGGVLVTPLEKDFERLDGVTVESIYEEVSLEGKIAEKAITLFCKEQSA